LVNLKKLLNKHHLNTKKQLPKIIINAEPEEKNEEENYNSNPRVKKLDFKSVFNSKPIRNNKFDFS